MTIAADPKRLGARIGIISVLHTWGSAMTHHPHVHMIVPGGGFPRMARAGSPAGRTSSCPSACSRGCSGALCFPCCSKRMKKAGSSSSAEHAALADAKAFAAFLRPLKRSEWVVYAKRPFAGPEAVLAYLSRYTHRVAISNSRLIAADARRHLQIQGLPHRGAGRYKTMTLATASSSAVS